MVTKKCFKCGLVKPINEFYKHKGMADGHINKCKTCAKKDAVDRYHNPETNKKIKKYETMRSKKPSRKRKARAYLLKYREKYPEKYKARTAVRNAIRDGRLVKEPCRVCGDTNSEAHHNDYSKYLDVEWLCFKHHRKHHLDIEREYSG